MLASCPRTLAEKLALEFSPQESFRWCVARWLRWFEHLPETHDVINGVQPRGRGDVTALVTAWKGTEPVKAFVAAMIWGYGDAGYGPYRTARVLTGTGRPEQQAVDPSIGERLVRSAEIIQTRSPADAFSYLSTSGRIRWLGPAFFTKWMYFASAGDDAYGAKATPILDNRVMSWIHRNTEVTLGYGNAAEYERYGALLQHWGAPFGRTPVQVEATIFRLTEQDREPAQNRRME